jgi:hypothetical protein
MVVNLMKDLFDLGWDGHLDQIKEKFGGLRFYIGGGDEAIFERINEAERESYHTCETCGRPGQLRGDGWMVTICNTCNTWLKKVRECEKQSWRRYDRIAKEFDAYKEASTTSTREQSG